MPFFGLKIKSSFGNTVKNHPFTKGDGYIEKLCSYSRMG